MSGRRDIDYQLKQAMHGAWHFFLIDEPSVVSEMRGFDTFYRDFCDSVQGVFAEFEASSISAEALLKRLNTRLVRVNLLTKSPESSYDSLYQLMDKHNQGLISIKAGQTLEKETVELIIGLLDYARKNKLAWKVFLVADTFKMDDMALAQIGVDQSIPDKTIDLAAPANNKSVRNKKKSTSAYRKSRSKNSLSSKLQAHLKDGLSTTSSKLLATALMLILIAVLSINGLELIIID